MNYSEKLRDPRWQKKRLEILERDGFACRACKDKSTELHIHHESYSGNPWEAHQDRLRTYCKHCHAVAEYLKKIEDAVLLEVIKRVIDEQVFPIAIVADAWTFERSVYFFNYINTSAIPFCVVGECMIKAIYEKIYPLKPNELNVEGPGNTLVLE